DCRITRPSGSRTSCRGTGAPPWTARPRWLLDVACRHWAELHAQTGSISWLHPRLHARARPAPRRGRSAAPLRRQPACRPPDGAHPRTGGADPTAARGRPLDRGARCSRAAPGLTLTLSGAAESPVPGCASLDAAEPALGYPSGRGRLARG